MAEPAHNLVWLDHPGLAPVALSALPAWLWSLEATRLLWANPIGAAIFAAPVSAAIRTSMFGSRGPAAIQVARLAATLRPDETRLARLRGLGTGVGGILSCACSALTLADDTRAVLVAATEPAGADWPLAERLRRLLAHCGEPVAVFSSGGKLILASAGAKQRLGGATTLTGLDADNIAAQARQLGRAHGESAAGLLTLQRVDVDAATILLARLGVPLRAVENGAENVVALRPSREAGAPALSAVERNAFHELTCKLQERLQAAGSAARRTGELPLLPPAAGHNSDNATAAESALRRAEAEIIKLETVLGSARTEAEKTAVAKLDFLSRISGEIRSPLNAIIGFSEIMAQEKLGPLENERYRQCLDGLLSSSARLMSLVNEFIDLSQHKAGKLALGCADVALNPMIQECVAILQPWANRERIIIRTSLSLRLPRIAADARSLRQAVLQLIAHATARAGPGGQVIVATALSDTGEVTLRLCHNGPPNNGPHMSETHAGTDLKPPLAKTLEKTLDKTLVKTLAEAGGAALRIKTAAEPGNLIEVTFPPERVLTPGTPVKSF